MIDNYFNSFEWQDAELKEIFIDRRNAGENDVIEMEISFPVDSIKKVRFIDCYAMDAKLNFAIISLETILQANILLSSPLIDNIKERYIKISIDVGSIYHFEIETNSTGSLISIVSKGFEVSDLS